MNLKHSAGSCVRCGIGLTVADTREVICNECAEKECAWCGEPKAADGRENCSARCDEEEAYAQRMREDTDAERVRLSRLADRMARTFQEER